MAAEINIYWHFLNPLLFICLTAVKLTVY